MFLDVTIGLHLIGIAVFTFQSNEVLLWSRATRACADSPSFQLSVPLSLVVCLVDHIEEPLGNTNMSRILLPLI